MSTSDPFDRLTEQHPHHALALAGHQQNGDRPGAIVTVRTPRGGTFYTGIKGGDRVVVTSTIPQSVAAIDLEGPRLSVWNGDTEGVDVRSLTVEEARAGKQAALAAAQDMLERAYASANGLIGAPTGDDQALAALRVAKEYRDIAFVYGVYAAYLADPTY